MLEQQARAAAEVDDTLVLQIAEAEHVVDDSVATVARQVGLAKIFRVPSPQPANLRRTPLNRVIATHRAHAALTGLARCLRSAPPWTRGSPPPVYQAPTQRNSANRPLAR